MRRRWPGVGLVVEREVRERLRSRAFRISTGVLVLLVCGVAAVSAAVSGGGPDTYTVLTVGRAGAAVGTAAQARAPALDARVKLRGASGAAAARRALRAGDADVAVVGPFRALSQDPPPDKLRQLLVVAGREVAVGARLRRAGLPAAAQRRALRPPSLVIVTLDRHAADRDSQRGIAFLGALLLYLALITYGLWIAYGVVEEKSSRVVELVLSAIRPAELLTGKIVGIGLLGLAQLALVIGAGLGVSLAAGSVTLPSTTAGTVALMLVWFLLGFAFYSCAYAAAAAIVSRQEDLQSSTAPLTVVLVASYFAALAVIDHPGGTLATVLTFVPPVAPVIVPARAALGALPAGEGVAAVALMALAILAFVVLAGRIYEGAVLRIGAPLRWREALRSAAEQRRAARQAG